MIDTLHQLILTLPAQLAKPGAKGFDPVFPIMMVGMIAIFYFMIIRPQKAQQKKKQDMMNALKPGDKIITTSGIYGEITSVLKNSIRVRVAQGVELRMSRAAIANKTSKDDEE